MPKYFENRNTGWWIRSAGGLLTFLLIIKVSVIGYYESEFPLLMVGFLAAIGLAAAGDRMNKKALPTEDRREDGAARRTPWSNPPPASGENS